MASTTSTQRTPSDSEVGRGTADLSWRLHFLASPDRALAGTCHVLGAGATTLGREGAIAIDDAILSRIHLVLSVAGGRVHLEDCGSRNGCFQGGRRIHEAWPGHGAVLRFGRTVAVLEADLGRSLDFATPTADVPGHSELARMVRAELELAARSRLPVLLIGETGTGKEHAALEVHRRSGRRGPLVRFNVAAVPHHLFESELFGHVAGAFTGASAARPGRVREAHGGTLVLDEIGELPEAMQTKLLRMVEENTVRPVGGNADLKVDVHFLASTNADLQARVRTGSFRRDLLARLRGSEVHLPRLAERLPDLLDLAEVVAQTAEPSHPAQRMAAGPSWRERLTPDALELLLLHAWPDNLRDLRSVLLRAQLLAGTGPVAAHHLPEGLRARSPTPEPDPAHALTPAQRPSAVQLHAWLAEHGGNIDAIARRVGRHRRQVYRWLQYAGLGQPDIEASRQGEVRPQPPALGQPRPK